MSRTVIQRVKVIHKYWTSILPLGINQCSALWVTILCMGMLSETFVWGNFLLFRHPKNRGIISRLLDLTSPEAVASFRSRTIHWSSLMAVHLLHLCPVKLDPSSQRLGAVKGGSASSSPSSSTSSSPSKRRPSSRRRRTKRRSATAATRKHLFFWW